MMGGCVCGDIASYYLVGLSSTVLERLQIQAQHIHVKILHLCAPSASEGRKNVCICASRAAAEEFSLFVRRHERASRSRK